jgi:GNAT superfamily N-acetyltransferase
MIGLGSKFKCHNTSAVQKDASHMKRTTRSSDSPLSILVRQATLRDLDVLVRHRRGMWEDLGIRGKSTLDQADRVYRSWARSGFRNGSLLGWIAETKDGATAGSGCIWLQPTQPRPHRKKQTQPYLLSMYTEPPFRRQGVASHVVKKAIDWCRKNGYPRLTLHASKYGRALYRKHGFGRSSEMRLSLDRKSRH